MLSDGSKEDQAYLLLWKKQLISKMLFRHPELMMSQPFNGFIKETLLKVMFSSFTQVQNHFQQELIESNQGC